MRRRFLRNRARGNIIIYPGLVAAWDILKEGKDNDHPDREWARDLTGNGHDIQWKNFAFKGMSGYGGYMFTPIFANQYTQYGGKIDNTLNKIGILKILKTPTTESGQNYNVFQTAVQPEDILPAYKIKITGINNNGYYLKYSESSLTFSSDGIYEIPEFVNTILGTRYPGLSLYKSEYTGQEDINVTIELLPKYEGAICLDGVDDFGINEDVPILTDFTLIVKRNYIETERKSCLFSKSSEAGKGAFIMELIQGFSKDTHNYVFYKDRTSPLHKSSISYLTPASYNGIQVNKGTASDTKGVYLGTVRPSDSRLFQGAFYCAYLFDRSLDEQEIKSFIRKYIDPEYLLPSEILDGGIPTPDCYYDFSQGSNDSETRETITDYSGNGNDAKAYNVAWSGMSGYGGYDENLNNWQKNTDPNTIFELQHNKIHITKFAAYSSATIYKTNGQTINKLQLVISGLKENQSVFLGEDTNNIRYQFDKDGTYSIEEFQAKGNCSFRSLNIKGECDITIELLPEYEGALVLDGVDDYIALEAFDSGFKTIFMVCNPFVLTKVFYGHRRFNVDKNYCIFNQSGNVAYTKMLDANYSKVYINNKTNTTLKTDDLRNKKHLININYSGEIPNLSSLSKIKCPIIGQDSATLDNEENFYMNMAIYKFLGFKEELTEEQIQYVIEKYNLLDGVDDIEVS